jgi:general secretion pathway protein J
MSSQASTAPLAPAVTLHRRGQSGFTLIEVMVSLFVLGVMAAMAWQGVDVVIRSRDSARARTDSLLRLHATLGQWEADLRAAVETQVVPGLNCDGTTLRLTRHQPDGAQVIAWTVRGNALYRWAAPPVTSSDALQNAWMQTYQLQGQEAGTLRALDGVQRLYLYQYIRASSAWTNCQSTGNVTQTGQQALPDGLRAVFEFAPQSAFAGPVTRDVMVVAQ